ncbi:hypothetical protein FF38_11977 [Lucilia cuprina]|uniref:Uncharacterized protein n=1 Tax=Lucilia cuprina TaxID=7375 RepID=A0A0L0CEF6_LUCCU|nr:hypothetical protein FF38_11977 [Lucilia cuprina]
MYRLLSKIMAFVKKKEKNNKLKFCVKSYSIVGITVCTNFKNIIKYKCTPNSPPPSSTVRVCSTESPESKAAAPPSVLVVSDFLVVNATAGSTKSNMPLSSNSSISNASSSSSSSSLAAPAAASFISAGWSLSGVCISSFKIDDLLEFVIP